MSFQSWLTRVLHDMFKTYVLDDTKGYSHEIFHPSTYNCIVITKCLTIFCHSLFQLILNAGLNKLLSVIIVSVLLHWSVIKHRATSRSWMLVWTAKLGSKLKSTGSFTPCCTYNYSKTLKDKVWLLCHRVLVTEMWFSDNKPECIRHRVHFMEKTLDFMD